MAALLEKMPPDYTLATCPEKPPDDTIKVRPVVSQKPEDITSKMPADWRQQLLRHIEAKRLDRVCQCSAHTCKRETRVHIESIWKPSLCVFVQVCVVRLTRFMSGFMCFHFTPSLCQPDRPQTHYDRQRSKFCIVINILIFCRVLKSSFFLWTNKSQQDRLHIRILMALKKNCIFTFLFVLHNHMLRIVQ